MKKKPTRVETYLAAHERFHALPQYATIDIERTLSKMRKLESQMSVEQLRETLEKLHPSLT